jgi:hypothetical protein
MSARIVAFDGTPVSGGAGMRVAIIEDPNGSYLSTNGRNFGSAELERLVAGGYVTRISSPLEATRLDGVVVYRHRDFVFPGVEFDADVGWQDCGEFEIAYMDLDTATGLLRAHAKLAVVCTRVALTKHELDDASVFARRGLMVVPGLRSSEIAAQLYGVLLTAATLQGNSESIRREIGLMLDDARSKLAMSVAAAGLVRPTLRSVDARLTDRSLAIGATAAPREAA